ncbi:MAG: hypothetical protein R2718_01815 [Solirubrobacterales bacterium]
MSEPGPSPFRYHLELTPAQLKLTHDALRSIAAEAEADEQTRRIAGEILEMLPDEEHIAQIRPDDDGRSRPDDEGPEDEPEGPEPPDLLA